MSQSCQEAGLDPLRGVPEQPNDGGEAHQDILHRQTVLVRSASQSQDPGVIVLHGQRVVGSGAESGSQVLGLIKLLLSLTGAQRDGSASAAGDV